MAPPKNVPTSGQPIMNKEATTSQREFEIYELLRQAALDDSILVREEDWRRIEAEAKVLWPNLGRKIYERGVYLSDMEMRICWMAILRIPPRGMVYILKRSKTAISLARARLYEKLNGEKRRSSFFKKDGGLFFVCGRWQMLLHEMCHRICFVSQ